MGEHNFDLDPAKEVSGEHYSRAGSYDANDFVWPTPKSITFHEGWLYVDRPLTPWERVKVFFRRPDPRVLGRITSGHIDE